MGGANEQEFLMNVAHIDTGHVRSCSQHSFERTIPPLSPLLLQCHACDSDAALTGVSFYFLMYIYIYVSHMFNLQVALAVYSVPSLLRNKWWTRQFWRNPALHEQLDANNATSALAGEP
jgi:hypothetical protein